MGKRTGSKVPKQGYAGRAPADLINVEAQAQAAKAARARVCEASIQDALRRFNCTIRVLQVTVDGQPQKPQIQVVALDAQAVAEAPGAAGE